MSTFSLGLNTGTYCGTGGTYGGYNSGYVSSTQINRFARDNQAGLQSGLSVVHSYIQEGDTDKAIEAYNSLLREVQDSTKGTKYALSDAEARSVLDKAYQGVAGDTMTSTIAKNTSGSFATGIKSGIPIIGLFTNGTSSDEARATMLGEEVSYKDKVGEYAGSIASGAATGAAVGAFFFGVGAPVGAVVGGLLGAAQTFIKDIF